MTRCAEQMTQKHTLNRDDVSEIASMVTQSNVYVTHGTEITQRHHFGQSLSSMLLVCCADVCLFCFDGHSCLLDNAVVPKTEFGECVRVIVFVQKRATLNSAPKRQPTRTGHPYSVDVCTDKEIRSVICCFCVGE